MAMTDTAIADQPARDISEVKTFLHVGCGHNRKDATTPAFNQLGWQELRFDINPAVEPDVAGTMTDMSAIGDGMMDAVFSSHNLEHLYAHEVPVAIKEFLRVLKDGGFVILTCPDLQSVCELVAQEKLLEPAYMSAAGHVSPLDILYGYRPDMARGNLYMAHRSGFTKKVLLELFIQCGFAQAIVMQRIRPFFDLWIVASKSRMSETRLKELANLHFPNEHRGTAIGDF